ncbi:MFS transporter [Nocardioides limicola]|uniref:MFS transporter n=1 Tax=Nocardioides limicola TaxID=2803368 RepID=UPI00193B3573|nr:MFS transporter [Nocardioides sp. DJM-14]
MATTTTPDSRDRLFTRGFILLTLGELAYLTTDGMAIFLIPVYAAGPLEAGQAGAGLAFGAFALSALALRPWVGRFADTRGRRPLLIGGALVAALALALTAQATDLASLVALRLLAGVGEAAVFTAIFAAIADLAPPSRMGEALSYNSLALYLGLAAGPPIAELMVSHAGFAAAWYLAAGLAVAAAATFVFVPESRVLDESVERHPLIHRPSLPVALGFLASIVAMGGFLAFVALHADDLGMTRTSLPLFLYGITVVVGRVTMAKLVDRVPPLRLAAVALVAMAVGLTVAATAPSPGWLLLGVLVLAIGVTFSTPAFFAAIFATAGPSERGAASAMASAALDLGLGAGPILLGYVAGAAGIGWAFGVAAGVALAGAGWTLTRRLSPR